MKEQEKLIWQKLESARPKECGKLVKQMLKLKLKNKDDEVVLRRTVFDGQSKELNNK